MALRITVQTRRAPTVAITVKRRRALRKIGKTIQKNRLRVQRQFAKGGVRLRPSIAFSAAKYLTTLEKLAKE